MVPWHFGESKFATASLWRMGQMEQTLPDAQGGSCALHGRAEVLLAVEPGMGRVREWWFLNTSL